MQQVVKRLVPEPHDVIYARVAHDPVQKSSYFEQEWQRVDEVVHESSYRGIPETHEDDFELIPLPKTFSKLQRADDELEEHQNRKRLEMRVVSRRHE